MRLRYDNELDEALAWSGWFCRFTGLFLDRDAIFMTLIKNVTCPNRGQHQHRQQRQLNSLFCLWTQHGEDFNRRLISEGYRTTF